MNATNEDMARIMGWHRERNLWETGTSLMFWVEPLTSEYDSDHVWNPIDNLNHTRLVEERIAELGLIAPYTQALAKLLKDARGRSSAWGFITAPAQLRCNALKTAFEGSNNPNEATD